MCVTLRVNRPAFFPRGPYAEITCTGTQNVLIILLLSLLVDNHYRHRIWWWGRTRVWFSSVCWVSSCVRACAHVRDRIDYISISVCIILCLLLHEWFEFLHFKFFIILPFSISPFFHLCSLVHSTFTYTPLSSFMQGISGEQGDEQTVSPSW